MALIDCPDCGKKISDAAAACPDCGRPIAQAGPDVQTIEQTSKQWKFYKLLSLAGALAGVLIVSSGEFMGGLIVAGISFATYLTVGMLTWWHHG